MKSNNIDLFDNNSTSNPSNSDTDVESTVKNHYWAPNSTIIQMIEKQCEANRHSKILEIGPGKVPFKLATDFIGCNEKITNYIEIDIDNTKFPYDNNSFDFIYCRHVLEDIQNPDFALNEMFRVSKFGGYIETPSPLIEATKNMDAYHGTDKYCGYMHHRYIVWSNMQKNEIYFLPKYSCILDHFLNFDDGSNRLIYNLINNYPVYWNNYFLYDNNTKPTIVMYKNGVNFGKNNNMTEEYIQLVVRAINESIQNTDYFIRTYR
jgi:predicted SAM-dependent methyltransferase